MTEPQHDRSDLLTGGELLAAISTTVVRVVADYTGRGPTRARTFINGDWIFVAVQDGLTKGERKLIAIGRDDFVLATRKTFQSAMREELSREVETLTGRTVIAFLSDNHVDPDIGLEAMLLAPDRSPPHGDGDHYPQPA
jgi:uncharacterized protein YbcI